MEEDNEDFHRHWELNKATTEAAQHVGFLLKKQ
jgi:hypothetical protein